jgi:hypothetical protein
MAKFILGVGEVLGSIGAVGGKALTTITQTSLLDIFSGDNDDTPASISDADGTRTNDSQPVERKQPIYWGDYDLAPTQSDIPTEAKDVPIERTYPIEQKYPEQEQKDPERERRQKQIERRRERMRERANRSEIDEKGRDYDGGDFDFYDPANPQFENDDYYDGQNEDFYEVFDQDAFERGRDALRRSDRRNGLRDILVAGGVVAIAGASDMEIQRVGINNVDRVVASGVPLAQNPLIPGPNQNPNYIPPQTIPDNPPDELDPSTIPDKTPPININPIDDRTSSKWIRDTRNNYTVATFETKDVDMCCC